MRRRDLCKTAVVTALGTAGGVAGALPAAAQAPAPRVRSAVETITYALNLKFLQAEFYRQGNATGLLSGQEGDLLAQIGYHKQQHVAALTSALIEAGGQPPVAPAVDFGGAFDSRESYLQAAAKLDNTVVEAYVGMPVQATFDQGEVFRDMSGIFSVDARAAAVLAALAGLGPDAIYAGGFAQAREPADVLEALQPWISGPWAMAAGAGITE